MTKTLVTPSGLAEQTNLLEGELLAAVERVFRSGWYVLGSEVASFEQEFAGWIGQEHGIGVNSGTDALTLALRAFGVGPGDEVILPSNALPTAYGVAATGATLVFADVSLDDYNLDPEDVRRQVTGVTKAIVAVHLYGHPAKLAALRAVCDEYDLILVEDCAQAHGAEIDGTRVGAFGDAAAFSFYPTKNLGAIGDAGMVLTPDEFVRDAVRRLRMYGERSRYQSVELGVNSRLDELQAAILRVKLPYLAGFVERRQQIAHRYDEALRGIVEIPPACEGITHARHLYPIRVDDRDGLEARLKRRGLSVAVHYPVGAHDQLCFADVRRRNLPVTEILCTQLISLPMHPQLTDEEADAVIEIVRDEA